MMEEIRDDLYLKRREFKKINELSYITHVFERYPEKEEQLKELIVRVPQILVIHSTRGQDALNMYTSELLNFYINNFIPECKNYILHKGKTVAKTEPKLSYNAHSFFTLQTNLSVKNIENKNYYGPICPLPPMP